MKGYVALCGLLLASTAVWAQPSERPPVPAAPGGRTARPEVVSPDGETAPQRSGDKRLRERVPGARAEVSGPRGRVANTPPGDPPAAATHQANGEKRGPNAVSGPPSDPPAGGPPTDAAAPGEITKKPDAPNAERTPRERERKTPAEGQFVTPRGTSRPTATPSPTPTPAKESVKEEAAPKTSGQPASNQTPAAPVTTRTRRTPFGTPPAGALPGSERTPASQKTRIPGNIQRELGTPAGAVPTGEAPSPISTRARRTPPAKGPGAVETPGQGLATKAPFTPGEKAPAKLTPFVPSDMPDRLRETGTPRVSRRTPRVGIEQGLTPGTQPTGTPEPTERPAMTPEIPKQTKQPAQKTPAIHTPAEATPTASPAGTIKRTPKGTVKLPTATSTSEAPQGQATPKATGFGAPPAGTPSGLPSGTPGGMPSGTPSGGPKGTPGGKPTGTPGEGPTATPGATPSTGTPGTAPGELPSGKPTGTPGGVPSGTPSGGPEGTPGGKPAGTPGGTTPPGTPGETPGTTPAATPGEAPAGTPAATPAGGPGATPAATVPPVVERSVKEQLDWRLGRGALPKGAKAARPQLTPFNPEVIRKQIETLPPGATPTPLPRLTPIAVPLSQLPKTGLVPTAPIVPTPGATPVPLPPQVTPVPPNFSPHHGWVPPPGWRPPQGWKPPKGWVPPGGWNPPPGWNPPKEWIPRLYGWGWTYIARRGWVVDVRWTPPEDFVVPPGWYYMPHYAYSDYDLYDPSVVVVQAGRARKDLVVQVNVGQPYRPPMAPPPAIVQAPPPPPRPLPPAPPEIPAQITTVNQVVDVFSRPREPKQPRYQGPVLVTGAVQFDFDSYAIRPESFATLDKIGEALLKPPLDTAIINVEGHTDAKGSDQYNQKLSEQRAWSVKSYLVQKFGIDPNRLVTVGFGESSPIATNETEQGMAMNRRVEFENVSDLYQEQVVKASTQDEPEQGQTR